MVFSDLYIVILNWNLKDETMACIQSVLEAGALREQIVVVDNASTDDSVEALQARWGDSLKLIRNERNLGYAGGVNVGIQYSLERGAQWILLLNNDTLVEQAMLEILLATGQEIPPAGILSPAIFFYDDPGRPWSLGDIHLGGWPIPIRAELVKRRALQQRAFQVDYVTGCAMLVRRQVFEQAGLLDASYYMYFEDADFCRRARQAGFTVWCVPQAKMWHKVSTSANRDKPSSRYQRVLNRVRFYRSFARGCQVPVAWAFTLLQMLRVGLSDLARGDTHLLRPLVRGWLAGWHAPGRRPSKRSSP